MTNEYRTSYDYFHSYTNPIWIKWQVNTTIEEEDLNSFSIFPNPATNQVTLVVDHPKNYTKYHLYNNLGQLVLENSISEQREIIDLSSYRTGLYNLVIFRHNSSPLFRKIIKR